MRANFRFYAELNDFLPAEHRSLSLSHTFELSASVKDMIESLGVPHPEIALILVNGGPPTSPARCGTAIASPYIRHGDLSLRTRSFDGQVSTQAQRASSSTAISAAWPGTCGCWGSIRSTTRSTTTRI